MKQMSVGQGQQVFSVVMVTVASDGFSKSQTS